MRKLLVLLFLLLFTPPVFAGGNIRPGGSLSPRALGLGGAHNAVVGDGAAFYHNVANINGREFIEYDLDTIFCGASFKKFGQGGEEESDLGVFPMPLLAVSNRLGDKLTLGTAIYPADGLGVAYDGLKYRESLLASINLTEAIAWEISDSLTVGAGLDLVYGRLQEDAVFDQLGFLVNSVFLKNRADGWGIGYRLGLRWQPSDWLAFGVSYASRRKVEMDCQSEVAVFGQDLFRLKGETSIGFPGRLGLGVAIKPAEKWLVVADVNFYDYSGLEKIKFDFGWLAITQNTAWRDNKSAHLGVEKIVNQNWTWRLGVACLWPAVPKSKDVPIIPDGMGYCGTVGLGWKNTKGNLAIDVAALYGQMNREIKPGFGRLAPRDNKVDVGVISVGITRYFGRNKRGL